jgi:hypothetical protein
MASLFGDSFKVDLSFDNSLPFFCGDFPFGVGFDMPWMFGIYYSKSI